MYAEWKVEGHGRSTGASHFLPTMPSYYCLPLTIMCWNLWVESFPWYGLTTVSRSHSWWLSAECTALQASDLAHSLDYQLSVLLSKPLIWPTRLTISWVYCSASLWSGPLAWLPAECTALQASGMAHSLDYQLSVLLCKPLVWPTRLVCTSDYRPDRGSLAPCFVSCLLRCRLLMLFGHGELLVTSYSGTGHSFLRELSWLQPLHCVASSCTTLRNWGLLWNWTEAFWGYAFSCPLHCLLIVNTINARVPILLRQVVAYQNYHTLWFFMQDNSSK
jgi:hypothetical protein